MLYENKENTIRFGHGPVLLDYPYIYKLDGNKLFCTKLVDPMTGQTCDGEIDYDCGFNHLVCTKCGKIYLACNLRDDSIENNIIIKGGSTMKVTITKGDKVLVSSVESKEVIKRPVPETPKTGVVKATVVNAPVASYEKSRPSINVPTKPKHEFNATVSVAGITIAGAKEPAVSEADTATNTKKPSTVNRKNTKAPKQNVKLVSVDEVKENKETNMVNIKVTVKAEPVEEETITEPEAVAAETVEGASEDLVEDEAATEEDDEPIDEIADKYADLYDEDDAPRKQPVRTKSTKKTSDGDITPKKKSTTRIPKK